LLLLLPSLHAQDLQRGFQGRERTLNTPRSFPKIETRAAWESRAKDIREQILISCGVYPLPEKTPLKATVFGKTECDGYTVEKVHLQPYPGFYLAGNLYRPLNKGAGPFPAILNPHGHWETGRMADEEAGSIRARCISFARQGMIAFTYDMVGYNDTTFAGAGPKLHRGYGTAKSDQLWGINLMGLQLWNSIRALDFLESLPDVDRKRLACTGESGGGTQTFC
jgi:cephalosporin-C deacetylase-like acetyl esterase